MASWQLVRLSLGLDRGPTTEKVCWRCALRQTRRHSSTLQGALSEGIGFSQKTYDALAGAKGGKQIHRKRLLRRVPTRKLEVDPFKPSRQPLVIRKVLQLLPLVKMHPSRESNTVLHIDSGDPNGQMKVDLSEPSRQPPIRPEILQLLPSIMKKHQSQECKSGMSIDSEGPNGKIEVDLSEPSRQPLVRREVVKPGPLVKRRGGPNRKMEVDPFEPSHQPLIRPELVQPLPLVTKHWVLKFKKVIHVDLRGQNRKDEQEISQLRTHERATELEHFASVDNLNHDRNEVHIRSGGPNLKPDTALQVLAPIDVLEPEESVAAVDSLMALEDVLNNFQDLRSRMARKSSPKRKWPRSPNRFDPMRSYRIRCYTTSTATHSSQEVPEYSSAKYQPAMKIPIDTDVGIRDRLRAWQKQQNADSEVLMPSGFPDSKLESQQNLLAQSGTGDGNSPLVRDDELSQDELMLRMDAEDQVTDATDNQTFLRKGDLVELLTIGEPILAIFIRNFATQSQFYTMQGKWVHRLPQRIKFSISSFATSDTIDRILPYLPTEEVAGNMLDKLHTLDKSVPREAGADLVEKMLQFHRAANSMFRKHADRLDHAFKILAHPTERRWFTLEEAATELFQTRGKSQLNDAMLWAVHRVLVGTIGIRMGNKKHRLSPIFDLLPRCDVDEISRVRQWLRDYQEGIIVTTMTGTDPSADGTSMNDNPFYNFVPKARKLIAENRKRRAVTEHGAVGPSYVKVTPVEPRWAVWKSIPGMRYTNREKQILEFINIWVSTETFAPGSTLSSLGPMIIRATGMYEGFSLRQDTGAVFLQEMGVIPPWQNRLAYNTTLNLPGYRMDLKTDRLLTNAKKSSDNFVKNDSMQSLRRDWGDMEVFCIDNTDVAERDDGISLEAIKGNDSEYWIHIHVANPSAFITPDSGLGRYAAHVTESIYFPERRFPMMDPDVVANYFSLANNKPSITFSARIRADGEILETNIVNGTVRNVRHLSRKTLRQCLSFGDTLPAKEIKNITVGNANLGIVPESIIRPTKNTAETLTSLTESQAATLRRLCELGAARRHKRERNGAINIISQQIPRPEPLVYFQAGGKAPSIFFDRHSQQFEGDPIISLDSTDFNPNSSLETHSSETLVPDCMILAGEIAATWCGQRNIPIAYRGTIHNPEPAIPPEQFKKEVIDVAIAKQGYAPLVANLRYLSLIGRSSLSASPLAHTILGAPYYCKITSPLRRYADLMAHWQIEAAIRYEAETGLSLIGNATKDSYLPFPLPKAEATISHIFRREDIVNHCSKSAARHWYIQLLFRAFYFKEAPLPETFPVYIYGANSSQVDNVRWAALTKEYGFGVDVEDNEMSRAAGGIGVGDWWEARIDKIQCHTRYIIMSPVSLIEKAGFTW